MADTQESAAAVAQNPAASPAERFDAQAEVSKSALHNLLIPRSDVMPVIDYIRGQIADESFGKSQSNIIPFPNKYRRTDGRGMQSVSLDEFGIVAQGQYWDRPGLLGFDSMRAMVNQTPILSSILLTRIHQVQRFCRPQMRESDAGFVIRHVDQNVELDETQEKSVKLLEQFILNCGWEFDPRKRKRLKRDSFSQFMAKSVADSLTMDAAPIETEFKRDRSLGLDGFYAVDGATIRLCTEEGYEGDDEYFALQVIQGRIRTAYTYDNLTYEVRNPRTDVMGCGYGTSETEMLIRVVTYMLNAMTYNGSFFDKNSIPRGILNLYGNYDQADLASFKRYWNAMVKGINNAHNLPVMVSKDHESKAEFTEIGGQMSEMAFGKWLTFLGAIACAVYGISPEEISLESFSASSKSSLSGDDTEEKITSSHDKGLRPLLAYYENVFSDYIVQVFSPQYMLRFAGLDGDDAKSRFEMRKISMTWNESRAETGFDPIPGPIGDAPINATLMQAWSAERQMEQQSEQEDFGNPPDGEEGKDPMPEDDEQASQDGAAAPPPAPAQPSAANFGKPPEGEAEMEKSFGLAPIYEIGG